MVKWKWTIDANLIKIMSFWEEIFMSKLVQKETFLSSFWKDECFPLQNFMTFGKKFVFKTRVELGKRVFIKRSFSYLFLFFFWEKGFWGECTKKQQFWERRVLKKNQKKKTLKFKNHFEKLFLGKRFSYLLEIAYPR